MALINECESSDESIELKEEYRFKAFVVEKLRANPNNMPKGRSGHRIVSDNGFVYSFGGFNPSLDYDENNIRNISENTLFKEFWRLSVCRKEWEKLEHYTPTLPKELASNAAIRRGTTMIVHGGTAVPFGQNCSNKTYVTNLRQNKGFELLETEGELPLPLYGQALALDGHKLYVIGGTSGLTFKNDIFCLDMRTKTWHSVYNPTTISPNEPMGRYRHEAAIYNKKIILLGGGTIADIFELEKLPAFNLETNAWEVIYTIGDPNDNSRRTAHRGFPAPRRCHGGVQIPEIDGQDPKFVICGGCNTVKVFSDIWTLNLKTFQWTKWIEGLKYPLNFHAVSLSPNGKMFIFGGICELIDSTDLLTVRTNRSYSVWVMIPKLSEMCWEALLFYNEKFKDIPKSDLLTCGVPINFVERLYPD